MKTMRCQMALGMVCAVVLLAQGRVYAATYYVDAARPNDAGDGLSWATAKKTIQAAVNLTANGDIVLVTSGVYATGECATPVLNSYTFSRVVITNNIIVRGVNGPAVTIIQGQGPLGTGAVRCVYMSAGMLAGFTLTNGFTSTYGSDRQGGGVYIDHYGDGVVSNCVISGNSADWGGGGVYRGTVYDCVISGNRGLAGGGTFGSTVNRCVISGNRADEDGGGTYYGNVINCIINRNWARNGGGTCRGAVSNCTIVGNSTLRGAAVEDAKVWNSIVYHNRGANWAEGTYFDSTYAYSCTMPLPPGIGNICSDPILVDSTHVHALSPCVGAGAAAYASGTDIDGEAWKNPPSMGCDEVYVGGLTGSLSVAITAPYTAAVEGTVLEFDGDMRGLASSNIWSFGDGVRLENRPWVDHAWAQAGNYAVILTVFNASNPHGVAATVEVSIVTLADATHYVNAANLTPSYPYQSWVTAARTIQEAVDAAEARGVSGGLVLVTNGIYASGERVTPGYGSSNRVVIAKNITVRSMNGPAVTSIQGQEPIGGSAVRCVYMLAGVLSGFTLTNGFTLASGNPEDSYGGAVNVYSGHGVVSNCVIRGNGAQRDGGGVCYGTVHDCVISGNKADNGGGTYYSTASNSVISGNTAVCGGGVCYGTVYDCVISGNTAESYGGGTYGGTVNKSVITGNRSGRNGGGTYGSVVNNSVISGNVAENGGGMYYGRLNKCIITNNSATFFGGGTLAGRVNGCVISGNSAKNGGGAYAGVLNNCIISSNTAAMNGGGICQSVVNNCVISGNSTTNDAGGAFFGIVSNCTVVGNTATNTGGGTYQGTVVNSIVWDNRAGVNNNHYNAMVWYSCTMPLPGSGAGNITNDPRFLNAAAGNYRLAESSPCINAGTNDPGMAWQTDLDGNPRIYLGDGVGIVDMGCYEYVPEPVVSAALVMVITVTRRRLMRH